MIACLRSKLLIDPIVPFIRLIQSLPSFGTPIDQIDPFKNLVRLSPNISSRAGRSSFMRSRNSIRANPLHAQLKFPHVRTLFTHADFDFSHADLPSHVYLIHTRKLQLQSRGSSISRAAPILKAFKRAPQFPCALQL